MERIRFRVRRAWAACLLGVAGAAASGCVECRYLEMTVTVGEKQADNRFEWRLAGVPFKEFFKDWAGNPGDAREKAAAWRRERGEDVLESFREMYPLPKLDMAIVLDEPRERADLVFTGEFAAVEHLWPMLDSQLGDTLEGEFLLRRRGQVTEVVIGGEGGAEALLPEVEARRPKAAGPFREFAETRKPAAYLRVKMPESLQLAGNAPFRDAEGYLCWPLAELHGEGEDEPDQPATPVVLTYGSAVAPGHADGE